MAWVEVKVTKSDIKNGMRRSCLSCPVARALRRTIGLTETADMSVDTHLIYCDHYEFRTPEKAKRFICRFDLGGAVEPFTFRLNLPRELVKKQKGI